MLDLSVAIKNEINKTGLQPVSQPAEQEVDYFKDVKREFA